MSIVSSRSAPSSFRAKPRNLYRYSSFSHISLGKR
nr:MAG TPA: hypothetical protein [Caudoviricetes sp.]